ncbi:hypothetical protein V5O48_001583 [Marasmius crinis-equi]|uniref:Uncharacterized protein n=1 Tax=Marasmius crinis-equi TaxID=585013 RepID=A0ABR3FY05_9AGAR
MNNPFSAWYDNASSGARSSSYNDPPPSVFGALPVGSPDATNSTIVTFTFTAFNPSIMNCTVVGPNNAPSFYVITDPAMPAYTLFKTPDGKSFGLIEWGRTSQVEVRGIVAKQSTSQFLRLSSDQRFRVMQIGGHDYMWIPGQGSIMLYPAGVSASNGSRLAQMRMRGQNVILEIDQNAARSGLLNPVIVAVVLLQSGRAL